MPRSSSTPISSKQGLKDYLENITALVMAEVAKKITELLYSNVNDLWYSKGWTPETHFRTGEVLDSITFDNPIKNGNKITVKIYFDTDLIEPHSRFEFAGGTALNEHMSIDGTTSYGGRSIGSWVVEWMEEGQGMNGGRSIVPYAGVHFFEKTESQVGDKSTGDISAWTTGIVRQAYRKYGIRIIG